MMESIIEIENKGGNRIGFIRINATYETVFRIKEEILATEQEGYDIRRFVNDLKRQGFSVETVHLDIIQI